MEKMADSACSLATQVLLVRAIIITLITVSHIILSYSIEYKKDQYLKVKFY